MLENGLDGELYLSDDDPPPPPGVEEYEVEVDSPDELAFLGSAPMVDSELKTTNWVNYDRTLAKWKDLTSSPHVKKECVKWARVGRLKTCRGWAFRYSWVYRTAVLRVSVEGVTLNDLKRFVGQCLGEAAVAGAVAKLIASPIAGAAVAEAAFYACLSRKVGEKSLTVQITFHTDRGGWE